MLTPALFERWPQLRERLPWLPLAEYPTPVVRVELPGVGEIWVKRDDISSSRYGGNKVRKLEFILGDAKARGVTRLITAGAAGSHHALATAVFGRGLGFDVTLVLFPQPLTAHVREVLLADLTLGAELRFVPRMTAVPGGVLAARLAHWRERCAVIPAGGSNPKGTLGFVSATLELAGQVARGELPEPDTIVLAAGTLGTAAGVALGLAATSLKSRIDATRITSKLVTNERALHGLVRHTARMLEQHGVQIDAEDAVSRLTLRHDQIGEGYGRGTPAAEAAKQAFAAIGLELDVTYTAKAAAQLAELSARQPGQKLLFWHTLSAVMPPATASPAELPRQFRDYLANGGKQPTNGGNIG